MKPRRHYEDYGTLRELPVSPLLGVVPVLLVLLALSLVAKVDPPRPAPVSPSLATSDVHVIALQADRSVRWNGALLGRSALRDKLKELAAVGDRAGIVVEADPALGIASAVEILDLVAASGLRRAAVVASPQTVAPVEGTPATTPPPAQPLPVDPAPEIPPPAPEPLGPPPIGDSLPP